MQDPAVLFPKLERAGEDAVRVSLAQGVYARESWPLVQEWLNRKEAERNAVAAGRIEEREQRRVDLAQEANDIARSAVKTARVAVGVAILAVVIAACSYFAKH